MHTLIVCSLTHPGYRSPPPHPAGDYSVDTRLLHGLRTAARLEESVMQAVSGRGTPRERDSRGERFSGSRRDRKPPSDDEIERGLRERAVSDPRAAEILLRWLQRPRPVDEMPGVDLDSMSEAQLEAHYAGLVRVAALPDEELRALIGSLLAETKAPPKLERSASRTTSSVPLPRNATRLPRPRDPFVDARCDLLLSEQTVVL
jgi:hypothetical protein